MTTKIQKIARTLDHKHRRKLLKEYFSEIGKLGGEATKRKGAKYFREMGRRSGEARRLRSKMAHISDLMEIPLSDIKKWKQSDIEQEYGRLMETNNI